MNRQEKKTLYLHIGMPKTATSALQRFFKMNSHRLKEQGLIYPETGQYGDDSHHDIPFSLAKNSYKDALPKAQQIIFLNRINEEVKDFPTVLLSSECFPMLGQHLLFFKFLVEYETKIICYLRRQDLFIESHYKQVIADPALPNLNYKIDKHIAKLNSVINYFPFIGTWSRLGPLIVRPFESKSFIDGNIFSDFCNAINIKIDTSFTFPGEDINPSDSNAFVELVRILKTHRVLDNVLRIVSVDALRALVAESFSGDSTSSFLSQRQRMDILKKFYGSNKKIAQLYLDKDELFTHPDMHDHERVVYDGLSQKEVFSLLSKIVDKIALEQSFLERWKYFDGMSEKEIFHLFSEILHIEASNDNPKKKIFSTTKKLLNRFSVTRQD